MKIPTSLPIPEVFEAGKLKLRQANEPAAPTLAFGDGDSGFYEESDDTLRLSLGGNPYWAFSTGGISDLAIGGSAWVLEVASDTNPIFLPNGSDPDTGIGRAGADILSLIAGGVEAMRLTEAAGVTKLQLQLIATASAPTYSEGAIYFDTTLKKLRVGGAAAWETITSA